MSVAPEALSHRARRDPPRRYPVIGFGMLAAFVLATYGLEIHRLGFSGLAHHAAPEKLDPGTPISAETHVPAASLDAAFVKSAKELRGVECLETATLPLDPPCRADASLSIQRFALIVKTELTPRGGQVTGKARMLRPLAIQLNQMTVAILPKVQSQNRLDKAADLSVNAFAKTAQTYVNQVDSAFQIDDPKWKGTEEPLEPAPVAEEAPAAAQPEATTAAKTAEPQAEKKTEEDEAVHDPALIAALVKGVAEVYELFQAAGHDPARVLDAVHQSGPVLEKIDGNLQRYRGAPHGDEAEQEKAQQFVSLIDQARGHVLRARIELQKATLAAGEAADGPFRAADELLEKAGKDVKAAEQAARTAP